MTKTPRNNKTTPANTRKPYTTEKEADMAQKTPSAERGESTKELLSVLRHAKITVKKRKPYTTSAEETVIDGRDFLRDFLRDTPCNDNRIPVLPVGATLKVQDPDWADEITRNSDTTDHAFRPDPVNPTDQIFAEAVDHIAKMAYLNRDRHITILIDDLGCPTYRFDRAPVHALMEIYQGPGCEMLVLIDGADASEYRRTITAACHAAYWRWVECQDLVDMGCDDEPKLPKVGTGHLTPASDEFLDVVKVLAADMLRYSADTFTVGVDERGRPVFDMDPSVRTPGALTVKMGRQFDLTEDLRGIATERALDVCTRAHLARFAA